jgi:hypothetical protein
MGLILGAIAAGILITLLLMLVGTDQIQQTSRLRSVGYRTRRKALISKLESLYARLAEAASKLSPNGQAVGDLERLVIGFEALVEAFSRLPAFGPDPQQLDSADFLVRDCESRISEFEIAKGLRSRPVAVRFAELFSGPWRRAPGSRPGSDPVRGCYFCSRPFHQDLRGFSQARVRVEGATLDVFSCAGCKDRLEETKKIKVLYFLSEGRPKHWSQVPGYVPSEEYWNLNRHGLRLVDTDDLS